VGGLQQKKVLWKSILLFRREALGEVRGRGEIIVSWESETPVQPKDLGLLQRDGGDSQKVMKRGGLLLRKRNLNKGINP